MGERRPKGKRALKAVHITTTDYGGAYRAAANISEAMKRQGIESTLLVREKKGMENVVPAITTRGALFLSRTRNLLNLFVSRGDVVNDRFGYAVHRHPLVKEADVIVLHWVNSFVSYRKVERLLESDKSVIWVMHDMWLFTGGCHYDKECGKYGKGCQACPLVKHGKGPARRLQVRKRRMLSQGNFTAVGCSHWITDCAKNSLILQGKRCITIPNPVDTNVYFRKKTDTAVPDETSAGRKTGKKKNILFGAMSAADERKGFDLLIKALGHLSEDRYMLTVVGKADEKIFEDMKFEYRLYGRIDSPQRMAEIYNEADVYVIPSRQENLSNAVTEAMACGVPVVAFAIGGMSDMIEHKRNGYLAEAFDCEALAEGIGFCVENKETLGEYAAAFVGQKFSYESIGAQYRNLCEELVKEDHQVIV